MNPVSTPAFVSVQVLLETRGFRGTIRSRAAAADAFEPALAARREHLFERAAGSG